VGAAISRPALACGDHASSHGIWVWGCGGVGVWGFRLASVAWLAIQHDRAAIPDRRCESAAHTPQL